MDLHEACHNYLDSPVPGMSKLFRNVPIRPPRYRAILSRGKTCGVLHRVLMQRYLTEEELLMKV